MEKRFLLFVVLSMLLMVGWAYLASKFGPPPPKPEPPAELAQVEQEGEDDAPWKEVELPKEPPAIKAPADEATEPSVVAEQKAEEPSGEDATEATPEPEQKWLSFGSLDPDGPYRLLVTVNSRGATLARVELADPEYHDLIDRSGYLGHLALANVPEGGCRVNVVGDGTPAALAGLQPGDVIKAINDRAIETHRDLDDLLHGGPPGRNVKFRSGLDPGAKIEIEVERDGRLLTFVATLRERPQEVVSPQPMHGRDPSNPYLMQPLSCRLTLKTLGSHSLRHGEIPDLPSLLEANWQYEILDEVRKDGVIVEGPGVKFYRILDGKSLSEDAKGPLRVVKRYRLAPVGGPERPAGYHLEFDIEIQNLADEPQEVAWRLDGPNGLPLEGWWYSTKIHPRMFKTAGARDVIWRQRITGQELLNVGDEVPPGGNHRLLSCYDIVEEALSEEDDPLEIEDEPAVFDYVGVDSQYFVAALMPDLLRDTEPQALKKYVLAKVTARAVGIPDEEDRSRYKTANVSFRVVSEPQTLGPQEVSRHNFILYTGPKDPEVLADYGLDDTIYFGWFPWVSKPMLALLHFFYWILGPLGTYGVAIILLTVLVRLAMYPIGRKAAMNAKKMQELAPEIKRLNEKYKDDMEKRMQAQQALFKQHNYNPFSGCGLLFLQLPIFLGLYRGLSVDIELRGAPLIPGLEWASNLAAPDMLFRWDGWLWDSLGGPMGWLGPYFNLLPLVTVGLFLVHQKLFTPPPTDEQTRMQHQMMQIMMIFFCVLFFKVPSGLCVYFITSSLWGIAERKLLPKTPLAQPTAADKGGSPPRFKLPFGGGNGTPKPDPRKERARRQKSKAKRK